MSKVVMSIFGADAIDGTKVEHSEEANYNLGNVVPLHVKGALCNHVVLAKGVSIIAVGLFNSTEVSKGISIQILNPIRISKLVDLGFSSAGLTSNWDRYSMVFTAVNSSIEMTLISIVSTVISLNADSYNEMIDLVDFCKLLGV